MQPYFFKRVSAWYKPLCTVVVLIIGITANYSFHVKKTYDDFWQQLGILQRDGTNNIKTSFATGYLQFAPKNTFKNILVGDRKAVASDLLNYTKQTVQSQDFKTEYERTRQSRKPRQEPKPPRTDDQIRAVKMTDLVKNISNTETALKSATDAETKKALEESLDYFKKSLAELKDPNNPVIKTEVQNQKKLYDNLMAKYSASMKEWETDFPENPAVLVKQRLQKLLDETKDVDYGAQLVEKNGKKYFVNPAYEAKNINWKFAFRAGKEVTETTRAFAQQWLKEL